MFNTYLNRGFFNITFIVFKMRSWVFICIEILKINPELINDRSNKNLIEMSINFNVI